LIPSLPRIAESSPRLRSGTLARTQQSHHASQAFPRCFIQGRLRAPSGGIPIASDTAHCGQKQILCAPDFCRGLTPTVWANMYTATDLCPTSISRLQRRQTMVCMITSTFFIWKDENRFTLSHSTASDKYEVGFPADDCFALACSDPKQLEAIDRDGAFSPSQQRTFFLTAQSPTCYIL
jgi:hypothetical protein